MPPLRTRLDLFVASVLVLMLELACIRWFPAHVLFLTFFTNVMLLASFLGISVGCLAAGSRRNHLVWTPLVLAVALAMAHGIEWERQRTGTPVGIGNHVSPQLVFFGVESQPWDPSKFAIPIEAICGALFVVVALALVGPGQHLGRLLARIPSRVEAYTINIGGSIAGILLFTLFSWWQLGPFWWFVVTLAMIAYLLLPIHRLQTVAVLAAGCVAALALVSPPPGLARRDGREFWSPYYRINYLLDSRIITVNLIGHQQMVSRNNFSPAYALPHILNRDTGRPPFGDVLVVGAGSGNDVSRALAWNAASVDAVEIDPRIQALGRRYHPDKPYADSRVRVHLDDGRNFLRSTTKQYDLIVYALVDSLVLHSGYSNIRLESYLFTTQAFADVKRRLKPGGWFVMYNYFRQGWVVARLHAMLEHTFGSGNPVVFNLPARPIVRPEDVMLDEFTLMFAGDTGALKGRFASRSAYRVAGDRPTDPSTPNGFDAGGEGTPGENWVTFRPTAVVAPRAPMALATDSWPFLYLRSPMIPELSLRGMLIMGSIGAAFILPFLRRPPAEARGDTSGGRGAGFLAHMFFLGAGFMLIETKAVVQMALLFGSTWTVNSVVFCAVLSMILLANLIVLRGRSGRIAPHYVGLFASLLISAAVPMDAFLGVRSEVQIAGACLLAFTPVFFAGVIFALSFRQAAVPDRAFGANVAGAILGGLSEYSSMLLGFQYVILVAVAFYGLSALGLRLHAPRTRYS